MNNPIWTNKMDDCSQKENWCGHVYISNDICTAKLLLNSSFLSSTFISSAFLNIPFRRASTFEMITLLRLHLSNIFKSVKNDFDSMMMNALTSNNKNFLIASQIRSSKIFEVATIFFLQSWEIMEIAVHWFQQRVAASRTLTFMMFFICFIWFNVLDLVFLKTFLEKHHHFV